MWPLPKTRYRLGLLAQKAPWHPLHPDPSPPNSSFHNDHSVYCTQRFFFPRMSFKCNREMGSLLGPASLTSPMSLRLVRVVASSRDLSLLLLSNLYDHFLRCKQICEF